MGLLLVGKCLSFGKCLMIDLAQRSPFMHQTRDGRRGSGPGRREQPGPASVALRPPRAPLPPAPHFSTQEVWEQRHSTTAESVCDKDRAPREAPHTAGAPTAPGEHRGGVGPGAPPAPSLQLHWDRRGVSSTLPQALGEQAAGVCPRLTLGGGQRFRESPGDPWTVTPWGPTVPHPLSFSASACADPGSWARGLPNTLPLFWCQLDICPPKPCLMSTAGPGAHSGLPQCPGLPPRQH